MWVIAETHDLPTRYAKMVVTDDQGRYVVPDLPQANYKVWVRGYGLVDSPKVEADPGKELNLTAVPAPNDAAAAQYYPAIYWYSMLKIPAADQFGGKSDIPEQGQAVRLAQRHEEQWLHRLPSARRPRHAHAFRSGARRVQNLGRSLGAPRAVRPGRPADGQHHRRAISPRRRSNISPTGPTASPRASCRRQAAAAARPRAQRRRDDLGLGRRRSIISHDEISTDKRNPTVNGYGPIFGSPEYSTDNVPILDPVKNSRRPNSTRRCATRTCRIRSDPAMRRRCKPLAPSPYWGSEQIWDTHINNHNSMFDEKGRLWLAAAVRGRKDPDFCGKGSDLPSAKLFPLDAKPAPDRDARSEDDEIHLRRHLLHHAPSAVRLRQEQHAVDVERRRRRRGRLAQHQEIPGDRRRRAFARLDRADRRHHRQRQARASIPSPASRSSRARTCASARCSTR